VSATYIVAPAALDDIDEIADWMRRENPDLESDLLFIEEAYKTFEFIAARPAIGHKRPDLTEKPVLFWKLARSFAVIYRPGPPVQIVHVRRWRQDLIRLLQGDLF